MSAAATAKHNERCSGKRSEGVSRSLKEFLSCSNWKV